METTLAIVAILAVSWIALVVLVRRAVRAVRRRVRSARDRARLRARAYGVGPASEVARQRREVARAVAGARGALAAAREVHSPIGDVPALLARLELAAHAVDGELRVLEALPDRARIAARLEGPRSRAQAIGSAAAQLTDGLLHAAGHHAEELGLLHAACAIEADALRSVGHLGRPAHQQAG